MAKITTFLYGLVTMGLVIGVLVLFMSSLNASYPVSSYNASDFEVYNQLENITSQVEATTASTTNLNSTNLLDQLGSFFTSAYKALKTTTTTLSTATVITEAAIDDVNLGEGAGLFKTWMGVMMGIFIIIGVILSAAIKRDL